MKRRILIISPHFPPVNAPDMQRVRAALPFLVAAGWDVTVLTVADPTPTAPVEAELLATVPPEANVCRVYCCSRRWTTLLGVNNVALRSLPFLFLRGCRLLAGRRYDVVYFSTTMFVVLPLGRLWRRLYGVPYVIDLQDPWISDFYERPGAPVPPGGWKYQFAQGLAHALEGWTLRRVSHLIVVSAAYIDVLRRRYAFFHAIPASELPFGSPDPDLANSRITLASHPALLPRGGLRLAFAGALGPGQLTAVETLFAGVAAARRRGINVSVHFFGTSYAPGTAQPLTHDLAVRHGVQDCVHEQPGRLRYFDALRLTLEADVNLLFGSTDLAFTPSKLLGVLAAGRPVLAIAPEGSAMAARLRSLGQDCIACSTGQPDPAASGRLADRLACLADGNRPAPPAVPAEYRAQAVAARQMEILSSVS